MTTPQQQHGFIEGIETPIPSVAALSCPKCGRARVVPRGSAEACCLTCEPEKVWTVAEKAWHDAEEKW